MSEWFVVSMDVEGEMGPIAESRCDGPFTTKKAACVSLGVIGRENMRKHRSGLYRTHRFAGTYWVGKREELEHEGWILPNPEELL